MELENANENTLLRGYIACDAGNSLWIFDSHPSAGKWPQPIFNTPCCKWDPYTNVYAEVKFKSANTRIFSVTFFYLYTRQIPYGWPSHITSRNSIHR